MSVSDDLPAAETEDGITPQISRLPFPVVGIGASAGGLAAVQALFEGLPAECGMAFVVILHLAPQHESHLDSILQRATRMPVVQVTKSMPIEIDRVYVISPRLHLLMDDGFLRVLATDRPRGRHVAIDLFFRTLAHAHRERAIGVVLSGTGADGAAGIARIREQGGLTLVQLPTDSEYEDMPRSAIASGSVDFVLPVVEIGQKILDVWHNARNISLPDADLAAKLPVLSHDARPEAETALREIVDVLSRRTGHDFTHYKRATVLRRIERRLQVRLLKDLPTYNEYLRDNPAETSELLADMLIGVTNFFRDREAFEALERDVIPALVANAGDFGKIRVWVAGCASGEEAYSIAILLDEEIRRADKGQTFHIFATDIDESAIKHARRGVYSDAIRTDVTPARLSNYFDQDRTGYRVSKVLREHVVFAVHNILRDPPFSRLDLVSCRNLLIYLDRRVQQDVMAQFHFSLKQDAVLFLGSSEAVDGEIGRFHAIDKENRIFRKVTAERRYQSLMPRTAPDRHGNTEIPATALSFAPPGYDQLHARLREQNAEPSALVGANGTVLHFSEGVGVYLRHSAGMPSHNLVELVHPTIRPELRRIVFQVMHGDEIAQSESMPVDTELGMRVVEVSARLHAVGPEKLILVSFRSFEQSPSEYQATAPEGASYHLERELKRMREQMQATVEKAEVSGEELKASNEELQSINEELRSTTEELETSKEELQSVNEELLSVNAELSTKVEEATRVTDDLQNFISSTDIATVFVDNALNVKRYTPRAEVIFNLIPGDVGRCLLDITHRLDYPTLASDTAQVLQTLQAREREVAGVDGHWFIARIRPYQAASRLIEGAILTFVDITSLRVAEERVLHGEDEARIALAKSNDFAMMTTNEKGIVDSWNTAAHALFGYAKNEMLGASFAKLFPDDVDAPTTVAHILDGARREGRFADARWLVRRDGGRVFSSAVVMPLTAPGATAFIFILRDATVIEKTLRQREFQLARARVARDDAEAANSLKDEFLAVMSHELKQPLHVVSVNTEILARITEDGVSGSPLAARALATISRAVQTQSRIVDDLLDLSRLRTGKLALRLSAVDVVGLVQAALDAASADALGSELTMNLSCDVPALLVHGDSARINQIVWNLLSNAVKFTPANGRIEVGIHEVPGHARIDVIDSGQGMEMAFLPHAFEMFGQAQARARSDQSGIGIGLALTRHLAELMGGRVEAHSDGIDRGARFTVYLPLYKTAELHKEAPKTGTPRCDGIRVLVVDDDVETVRGLKTLLELQGAEVESETSGLAALGRLAAAPADVVITDLGMPGMDGFELLRQAMANPLLREVPMIALTGFGRESDIRKSLGAGFVAHVTKPLALNELLACVAKFGRPRQLRRTRESN